MSRQRAIDQMCKECIYDPKANMGAWRQQTGACESSDCPLWPYRPKSTAGVASGGGEIPDGLRRYQEARRQSGSNDA